ncbi:polysaccharide deacetylase family protein [Methylomagnum sp.]
MDKRTRMAMLCLLAAGLQTGFAEAESVRKGESKREPLYKKRPEVQIIRYNRDVTCKLNPELKCGKKKTNTKDDESASTFNDEWDKLGGDNRVRAEAETQALTTLLNNGEFTTPGTTANKAAYWQDGSGCINGWGTYTRVAVNNSSGAPNQVMKLTGGVTSAAGCQTVSFGSQGTSQPVDVVGWVKGEKITRTGSGYGAFLVVRFLLSSGDSLDCKTLANVGSFDWRFVGVNSYADCYVEEPIASVKVLGRLYRSAGNAYFDNIRAEVRPTQKPTLSLVFDDGYKSTYTVAYPKLASLGIPASSAPFTDNIGSTGGVTYAQLWDMVKNGGWDVLSHSKTHADIPRLNQTAAINELQKSQEALRTNIGGPSGVARQNIPSNKDANGQFLADKEPYKTHISIQDFVWPYGSFNANSLGLAQQYYRSGRTAMDGSNNASGTYPWTVLSWTLESATTLDAVAGWLSDGCNNNRWTLIMAHTIGEDPSDGYDITPAFLDKVANLMKFGSVKDGTRTVIVNCPAGFYNNGGFDIKTYSDAITLFGATTTPSPK